MDPDFQRSKSKAACIQEERERRIHDRGWWCRMSKLMQSDWKVINHIGRSRIWWTKLINMEMAIKIKKQKELKKTLQFCICSLHVCLSLMTMLFSCHKTDEELHISHLHFSPVIVFCIHCSISLSVSSCHGDLWGDGYYLKGKQRTKAQQRNDCFPVEIESIAAVGCVTEGHTHTKRHACWPDTKGVDEYRRFLKKDK